LPLFAPASRFCNLGIVDSSSVRRLIREEAVHRGAELAGSASGPGSASGSGTGAAVGRIDPLLWLRQITGQVLVQLHRERFGPDFRDDISLYRGALPETTSISLAAQLAGPGRGRR
jgi:hypothetical protein